MRAERGWLDQRGPSGEAYAGEDTKNGALIFRFSPLRSLQLKGFFFILTFYLTTLYLIRYTNRIVSNNLLRK